MRDYIASVEDTGRVAILHVQDDNPGHARQLIQEYYKKNFNVEVPVDAIRIELIRRTKRSVRILGSYYLEGKE